MKSLIVVLCVSAVFASIPSLARAEWLSLRDGGLLETKGPWKEKGKMIVYTAPTGPLMSVRASEVDLEMSKAIGTRLKKATFVDLGIASDPSNPDEASELIDERGLAEQKRLQKFVKDPNAPRVAGTLSAQSNESAAKNIDDQMESPDEEMLRQETASCSRFDETAAKNVCILRASISSAIRKDDAARREERENENFVASE
ncbi:MAG: hypothetical protein WCC58_11125 [Burkholderiales bacterium]